MFVISTFYNIFKLSQEDSEILQRRIRKFMTENDMRGTVLIGVGEGVNSTIAGSRESMDKFYEFVKSTELIKDTTFKESFHTSNPFDKIKVRMKKEIVTLGSVEENYDFTGQKGKYVAPEDWDQFISRDDVVILDTRNDYEYHVGTFEGAINPVIDNFRELPKWLEDNRELYKNKKLATFCTGGIRCEKLTAYMVQNDQPEVYHLEGGILEYFEKTGNKNKKWVGDCFVFDNRIAVNDKLQSIL